MPSSYWQVVEIYPATVSGRNCSGANAEVTENGDADSVAAFPLTRLLRGRYRDGSWESGHGRVPSKRADTPVAANRHIADLDVSNDDRAS